MKYLLPSGLACLLFIDAASAQIHNAIHSRPDIPPREALERLNLQLAWQTTIPMDGRRDGLATAQLDGRQMFVQTRSSLITALDAETGRVLWRVHVGKPYQTFFPLGFNRYSVFVLNGTRVYSLDRDTGVSQWEYNLGFAASDAPIADEVKLYIASATNDLYSYLLPAVNEPFAVPQPGEQAVAPPGAINNPLVPNNRKSFVLEPVLTWQHLTRIPLEWAPLQTRTSLFFISPTGVALSLEKFPRERRDPRERFRFQLTDGPVMAPPAQFDAIAYVPSQDGNLYAINIDNGRAPWRFTAGPAIIHQPLATEQDIYITADRIGLIRLDRINGEAMWHLARGPLTLPGNPEADQVLAVNNKFVYAWDASHRLVVLDRAFGTVLGVYPCTHDYTLPIVNSLTDRIYLGANNGQIICLHDRDIVKPYRHSKLEERTLDPRVVEIENKLARTITDPGGEPMMLGELLRTLLEKNNGLKYLIADNAFREAGVVAFDEKLVTHPRVNNVPLGDVLRRILSQVDATFRVVEDRILIYPAVRR